jgi:hypothetical protein
VTIARFNLPEFLRETGNRNALHLHEATGSGQYNYAASSYKMPGRQNDNPRKLALVKAKTFTFQRYTGLYKTNTPRGDNHTTENLPPAFTAVWWTEMHALVRVKTYEERKRAVLVKTPAFIKHWLVIQNDSLLRTSREIDLNDNTISS